MFSIRFVSQQVVYRFVTIHFVSGFRCLDKVMNFKFNQILPFSKLSINASNESCDFTTELFEQIDISLKQYFRKYIDESVMKDNMWLFQYPPDEINKKMKLLSKMHFKSMNHGIPFLKESEYCLSNLALRIQKEAAVVPGSNRLYYLSNHLKVDPYILAGYISSRFFIYKISFDNLQRSLEAMLELGVEPIHILNDLWSLKYNDETIRARLKGIKELQGTKVMPWMIRCPQKVLQRSVLLKSTTKEILGDELSPDTYLAKRLNTTPETIQIMSTITRSIKTTRVSKLKEMVDYLLENGYTDKDIIEVPKIFAHSLQTIRRRKEILKSMGIEIQNLTLFCRSRKDFKHYCESFMKTALYRKKRVNGKENVASKQNKKKS